MGKRGRKRKHEQTLEPVEAVETPDIDPIKARAVLGVETRPVTVNVQGVTLERRGGSSLYWPDANKIPGNWLPMSPPCPECRCVCLSTGGQAAVVVSRHDRMQYFRCKNCGARFKRVRP